MPWKEVSIVSQRKHFYHLWKAGSHSMSELCRLFNISRKTGYKWTKRGGMSGAGRFENQSRRPHHSPSQTSATIEKFIIDLRKTYPAWGGRKLRKILESRGMVDVPAASTISTILKRHGLIKEEDTTTNGIFVLSMTLQTICGKWTSKAIIQCHKNDAIP